MGIFEKLMKKRQERKAEISKLDGDLEKLKADRDRLVDEINAAIDGDDTALAEKLVNQRRDLETKIEVTELSINRKSVQDEDLSELIEAANKETEEYQRKIDHAGTVALDAKKEYLAKLLDLASLVNEAWERRTQYCSLIPGVEDPTTRNAQTSSFKTVRSKVKWDEDDEALLDEIKPGAVGILKGASWDHYNGMAGRIHPKHDPGVTISKRF